MSDFSIGKRIHLIGVGGISMSAIAKMCISAGMIVSGSDKHSLPALMGDFYIGHDRTKVDKADIVVHSSAISTDDAELSYARKLHKTIYERGEYLALLARNYKNCVAVSGTHGKTTTTAMILECVIRSNSLATVHLGGVAASIDDNLYEGGKDMFITEACEYRKSLLHLSPQFTIVTNIDDDHPDSYNSHKELEEAFLSFAQKTTDCVCCTLDDYKTLAAGTVEKQGYVIVGEQFDYGRIPLADVAGTVKTNVLNYVTLEEEPNRIVYALFENGQYRANVQLNICGNFNITNSLFAYAFCDYYGLGIDVFVNAMASFGGTKRRQEYIGTIEQARIYNDYAHHPAEIIATLKALKKRNTPLYAIFEPHTYSRTKLLLERFSECFKEADMVAILPTYAAREKVDKDYDSLSLLTHITHADKRLLEDLEDAIAYIISLCQRDSTIVIMSAGTAGEELPKRLKTLLSN